MYTCMCNAPYDGYNLAYGFFTASAGGLRDLISLVADYTGDTVLYLYVTSFGEEGFFLDHFILSSMITTTT